MAMMDFSIDTSGSPEDVQRKQKLADALMKQGMDSTPAAGGKNGGWATALNRGLAGALGGYQQGSARAEEQQGKSAYQQQLAAALGDGTNVTPGAMIGLAGNPWANPAQTSAITHVADMQAQKARQGVEDQHWNASFGLQKQAAARAEKAANEGVVEKAAQREQLLTQRGIDPKSPEGQAFIISGEWAGPGSGGASLTPVYGVGPDGKPAMVQTTKTGTAVQTKLPEGFQISKEPIKIDAGTHWQMMDPQTRQIISTIPKEIASAAAQKVVGTENGKAQVGLPQAVATAEQTLKSIEDVRTHPGRNMMTTGAMGWAPGIPGTEGRGFTTALDQLKGKTFLEAFNSLRGGGAITDSEGSKATVALARLDRAQNSKDFETALNDLRDVVKAGLERARTKAAGGTASSTMPGADPAAPIVVDGYTIRAH